MTDVCDFRVFWCQLLDVINHSRQVFVSMVWNAEIEELFVLKVGIESFMSSGVLIASEISKPDIVASLSCDESRCFIRLMDDPRIS